MPVKKSAAATARLPVVARHLELGVEGEGDGGVLGGGVGVGDRTADGAAVADLGVPDERRRLGEQRHGTHDLGVGADRRLGGAGADPDRAVRTLDTAEGIDPADVDEVLEDRQPEGEHRDEALAPGEHLGFVAELGQQGHGFLGQLRRVVLERRRLHARRTLAAWLEHPAVLTHPRDSRSHS